MLGLTTSDMPETIVDLQRYVDEMVHSDRLAATPQARGLAQQVLFPPAPTIFRPLMHLNAQLTCGLLPQPVREIYGMEWSRRQERLFNWSMSGLRQIVPRLPMSLRLLPITERLMREGSLKRRVA